jgi:hypothetical protein
MKDKRIQAMVQINFCKELMERLSNSINENINLDSSWCGIRNHTQISNDIVRLRRELLVLNKLMNPYD